MLNLTNQSDYGILFISSLINKTDYVPLSELIHETKLPRRFLARIAAELVKQGIVVSREGKTGGYTLAKGIEKVSLYDYLRIFEGDLSFVDCSKSNYTCQWEKICSQKNFLSKKLSLILKNELMNWKLIDVIK